MIILMFNIFNISSFYVGIQTVLSICSSEWTTWIIFLIGNGVSYTVSIYEKYLLPYMIMKFILEKRD
jgi:actin-related protein